MRKRTEKPSTEKGPKEKPTPEAKALSLFLMAHKSTSPTYRDKAKRINRLWDLVTTDKLSKADYMAEVKSTLTAYGGYSKVVEQTVKFYIKKTGEWKLQGDDKYCRDAQKVADELLKK
ncbi:MAG: hypothetical protein ACI9RM_002122 [Ulvibacter sp.]|jgi:hypothetical protein